MTQTVIALVGISGVGKSTLLAAVSGDLSFQHLQASALIKQARQSITEASVTSEDLRHADIDDNQALLIRGFQQACDPHASVVLLDGHTIIDTPSGLITIAPQVFAALGVRKFIFLADDPEAIRARRQQHTTRSRPARSADELAEHQTSALLAAFHAARFLKVPLLILTPDQTNELRAALSKPPVS